jgi:lysine biosynthesis protein LysW
VERRRTRRLKARCPECMAPVWLKDNVELWEPVTCPECHTALEVVRLHPLTLDYMTGWDDDFDDDDFDDE